MFPKLKEEVWDVAQTQTCARPRQPWLRSGQAQALPSRSRGQDRPVIKASQGSAEVKVSASEGTAEVKVSRQNRPPGLPEADQGWIRLALVFQDSEGSLTRA